MVSCCLLWQSIVVMNTMCEVKMDSNSMFYIEVHPSNKLLVTLVCLPGYWEPKGIQMAMYLIPTKWTQGPSTWVFLPNCGVMTPDQTGHLVEFDVPKRLQSLSYSCVD